MTGEWAILAKKISAQRERKFCNSRAKRADYLKEKYLKRKKISHEKGRETGADALNISASLWCI